MKKLLIFLLLSTCLFAETKYLGKVIAITSTKKPHTQFHIIYTTQEGVVGVIENIKLPEQLTINTSTYCIDGFLIEETFDSFLKPNQYRIVDNPPSEQKWQVRTHDDLKQEIQALRTQIKDLRK